MAWAGLSLARWFPGRTSPDQPVEIDINQSARSAWETFRRIGGIELNGRDADLEDALCTALSETAGSFDEALETATTVQLVRAMLRAIAPFAVMFQEIMGLYKQAQANEGANHWHVPIGEQIPDLADFEHFLSTMSAVDVDM